MHTEKRMKTGWKTYAGTFNYTYFNPPVKIATLSNLGKQILAGHFLELHSSCNKEGQASQTLEYLSGEN